MKVKRAVVQHKGRKRRKKKKKRPKSPPFFVPLSVTSNATSLAALTQTHTHEKRGESLVLVFFFPN